MVDYPRRALRPGGLAIHTGSGGPSRQADRLTTPPSRSGAGRRAEVSARVYRPLALAQLEMQLWLADAAGRADLGDHLAAVDRVALLDEKLVAMSIGRDPAIAVLDEHQIAVTAQFIARVRDNAGLDRLDRSAARGRDVDAVIVRPIGRNPVAGQHPTPQRPREMPATVLRRRGGGRRFGARLLGRARLARRECDRLRRRG